MGRALAHKESSFSLPIDAPERRRLPLLLRHAWYSLNQAFRRRITHLSITPDQFTVLRTLQEHPVASLTQRKLAELMSSDPNTVAALLLRMERNGWLERRSDSKDKRARQIVLLTLGKKTYAKARKIALTLQQEALSALPTEEHDHFLEQLAALAQACRMAAAIGPRPAKSSTSKTNTARINQ